MITLTDVPARMVAHNGSPAVYEILEYTRTLGKPTLYTVRPYGQNGGTIIGALRGYNLVRYEEPKKPEPMTFREWRDILKRDTPDGPLHDWFEEMFESIEGYIEYRLIGK
jgi:hypothetical protein